MNYSIIYMTDVNRTVTGIIIDSQYTIPAIANKLGSVTKAYADAQISAISNNVIPYKIETENGNLAGYFALQINNGIPSILQMQVRPAFVSDNANISILIGNFIISNLWNFDYLN